MRGSRAAWQTLDVPLNDPDLQYMLQVIGYAVAAHVMFGRPKARALAARRKR